MALRKRGRIKAEPAFETEEDFFHAVNRVATLRLKLKRLTVERDQRIQTIQKSWNPTIKEAEALLKVEMKQCQAFAQKYRDNLFMAPKKSRETALAVFGFRKGQPHLKPLSKWTWKKVTERIKELKRRSLLIVKQDADREMILKKVPEADLGIIGLRRVQNEDFYVDPKADSVEVVK